MPLHTQQSFSGFIASEPQQPPTESGDTRLYVRVGQPHFRREANGGFTELEPSFHDLVTYRATADRALTQLAKGVSFIAEGYIHSFHVDRDGEVIEREEFVAKKIGHDLARTNYEVDGTRRPAATNANDGPAAESSLPARTTSVAALGLCSQTMPEPSGEWLFDDQDAASGGDSFDDLDGPLLPESPHPVNWNLLTAADAENEWIELNRWTNWLRHTYGLPASVVPPFWHPHTELLWELSALHLHWLCTYDPDQHGSAPFGWHRDFADARQRLHDWVATSGTRLDRDRPTRLTTWPGELSVDVAEDLKVTNRDDDFAKFVIADIAHRRESEAQFFSQSRSEASFER